LAQLAINEPLLELFEIFGVSHEGLREQARIAAGFIGRPFGASGSWVTWHKTPFVCHILWLLKPHGR
jgi:hypothetical protein